MNRIPSLGQGMAAIALALACSAATAADSYPNKPIRIVVPYSPGGAGDITARIVTQKMGENMGQPFVVDNRPGAGAIAASSFVAKSDADGYTLLLSGNNVSVNAALFKALPNDVINDFVHVSTFAFFDLAMIVSADSPFKSVQDVLAYARANPGKLNLGSINVGSTQQLAASLFQSMSGIKVQLVPYRATSEVVTALRSKDIQVGIEIIPPIMGQISSGTIRALGVASKERSPLLPNVPTISESGVPGYEASSWNGLTAPPGTPAAIVNRLQQEVVRALAVPEVKQRLEEVGAVPRASTPEQIRDQIKSDYVKWKAVVEQAGIPLQ